MNKSSENMFAEERKRMIVNEVNKRYKITVPQLCELFMVSPATIRNDLRDLESLGYLKRTHGGAIKNNEQTNFELNSVEKEVSHVKEKAAIADTAVRFVREGDTIILDTGTTLYEFSKKLKDFKSLTVVTNDLQIALFLEKESSVGVILLGGSVRKGFHCAVGARTMAAMEGLHVDKAFIAANGVSATHGITTPNIEMSKVKEFFVQMANEVYLLADSSKMGRTSFSRFAELKDIDMLITDGGIPGDFLQELRDMDVDVTVAAE
jgi:DeoR family fructose operon transcriptional repressor